MDPLKFFNIHSVAKHEKIEENKNFHFREKISQCRKKTERGDSLGFFNIHSVAKHQKKCRGTLWGKIFFSKKKSRSDEKNERGESLVSPGMVCYAEKQEKPFWFSSLDQIVHFDAVIFYRTFVQLFWSVRVDRKKRVTIIVAFHFMKRRLKMVEIGTKVSSLVKYNKTISEKCTGKVEEWINKEGERYRFQSLTSHGGVHG